jgi:hypothetical protein
MPKPDNKSGNRNEAPTAVYLSNTMVLEDVTGIQIGTLTAADPNRNDAITYQVFRTDSSGNLLVVNGQPVSAVAWRLT